MAKEKRSSNRNKVRTFFILENVVSILVVYILYMASVPTALLIGAYLGLMYNPFNRLTEKCAFITSNFVMNSEKARRNF